MDVEKIDNFETFLALGQVWNDLLAAGGINTIFLTHDWIRAWWETFGREHELFIFTVKSNDGIIGIAPLMLTEFRGLWGQKKVIQFIGTPNADYSDFIGKDKSAIVEAVLSYFIDHSNDWTQLELSQIPENSSSREPLRRCALKSGIRSRIKEIETVYMYSFDGPETDRSQFTLKKGSTFKRNQNFFKKHDGLNLERIRDTDRIKGYLPYFFQCHINRWKTLGLPGKFLKAQIREFHEKLVNYLSPLERISFLLLKHGEIPLASLFAFDYEGTVSLYNIATESFYERRSPGIIILHFLTEHFVREGYHIIDFSRGEGSHKARFINRSSKNYQYSFYRNSSDYRRTLMYDWLKSLPVLRTIAASPRVAALRIRLSAYLKRQVETGMIRAVKNTIKSVLSPLFSCRRFFQYELNSGLELSERQGIEVNFGQPGPENIEQIANFYNIQENSKKHSIIMKRFQGGADCFAAFYNDLIISMAWGIYDSNEEKESGLKIAPGSNQVILSDLLTSDLYYDTGIQTRLMTFVFNFYKERGIRVLGAFESNDKVQMHAVKELKCKIVGSKISLRLLGIRFF